MFSNRTGTIFFFLLGFYNHSGKHRADVEEGMLVGDQWENLVMGELWENLGIIIMMWWGDRGQLL